jgi:arylsulfatase A-like enzyme
MQQRAAEVFSRDGVREHVLPAYMGLIKQIDDQIGNLMAFLEERGLLDNTMIVFCSDHGDYLGDHWMGEKDMFHEQSVRVPLIICDPRQSANATRGTVEPRLVEGVDLLPTFVEACGGEVASHIVEGRSLAPLLAGEAVPDWRQVVFSEYDYGHQRMRVLLDREPDECRMIMVFDGRYKMVYFQGYRPLLHDLETDPEEYFDRGEDPEYAPVVERLTAHLNHWALTAKYRVTRSDSDVSAYATNNGQLRGGIVLGFWDEAELLAARKKAGIIKDEG